jgi:hypothetical protein
MIWDAPTPPPDRWHLREITKAVAIAALSVAATGLVNWGIDALKKATTTTKEPEPSPAEET